MRQTSTLFSSSACARLTLVSLLVVMLVLLAALLFVMRVIVPVKPAFHFFWATAAPPSSLSLRIAPSAPFTTLKLYPRESVANLGAGGLGLASNYSPIRQVVYLGSADASTAALNTRSRIACANALFAGPERRNWRCTILTVV